MYDPLGEWVGEQIYGRGVSDMKGAGAAMMQVALAYARTETEPPVTLKFAFVSDEETGDDAGLTTLLETSAFDPQRLHCWRNQCAERAILCFSSRSWGHLTNVRSNRHRCTRLSSDDRGKCDRPID